MNLIHLCEVIDRYLCRIQPGRLDGGANAIANILVAIVSRDAFRVRFHWTAPLATRRLTTL